MGSLSLKCSCSQLGEKIVSYGVQPRIVAPMSMTLYIRNNNPKADKRTMRFCVPGSASRNDNGTMISCRLVKYQAIRSKFRLSAEMRNMMYPVRNGICK